MYVSDKKMGRNWFLNRVADQKNGLNNKVVTVKTMEL